MSALQCEAVRRVIGAEPMAADAGVDAHVATCEACLGYRAEMRNLESRIRGALELPLQASPAATVAAPPNVVALEARRAAPASWRRAPLWYSVAASVALVSGVLAFGLLARPTDALAAAVVAHMAEEPDAWSQQRPVPQSALDYVLRQSGVRLDAAAAPDVVYAHSCFFRGRYVPHLVVLTEQGPVTVLVLRGEAVTQTTAFEEAGYSGVLIPTPSGAAAPLSLALLSRGPLRADPQSIARKLAPVLVVRE
jgi:hypothetical protein